MQILKIDQSQEIPLVYAIAKGPTGHRRLKLVFDTGCGTTQIDTALLENLGYSASNGLEPVMVMGPAGDPHEGYTLRLLGLSVFDRPFIEPIVAAYDLTTLQGMGFRGFWAGISLSSFISSSMDPRES